MFEQSKSAKRRYGDGDFHRKYFRGKGIDIGSGGDSVGEMRHAFVGISAVVGWDVSDGDGQYLGGVRDNCFDFVHSSHSLEHMDDWKVALDNWVRVCRPGGYLIISVPEEYMYEKDSWPSAFNKNHRWSFTLRWDSNMPNSVNVMEMTKHLAGRAVAERIQLVEEFYRHDRHDEDQTRQSNAECCIEIVLRKYASNVKMF